jgi:hypothetical protein
MSLFMTNEVHEKLVISSIVVTTLSSIENLQKVNSPQKL